VPSKPTAATAATAAKEKTSEKKNGPRGEFFLFNFLFKKGP
jgi:hypothetical protein